MPKRIAKISINTNNTIKQPTKHPVPQPDPCFGGGGGGAGAETGADGVNASDVGVGFVFNFPPQKVQNLIPGLFFLPHLAQKLVIIKSLFKFKRINH